MNYKNFLPYLIGILLIFLIAKYIGFSAIKQAFVNANFIFLLPIIILEGIEYLLQVKRFDLLFKYINRDISKNLIKNYAIGHALAFIVPSRAAGELVRVYTFKKLFKLSLHDIFAGVSVERVMDVFVLGITVSATAFLFADKVPFAFIVGLIFALIFIMFILLIFSTRLQNILMYFFSFIHLEKMFEQILNYFKNSKEMLNSSKRFFSIFVFTLILWFFDFLRVWFVFKMFNINLSFILIAGIIALSYLVSVAFVLPGGLGVFEGGAVAVFVYFGVNSALAFSAMFVERIFSYWIWIVIGFFALSEKIVKRR